MTQSKFKYLYDGMRLYFFDTNKLSIDDFFKLEQIAAFENEIMKHKIFFVYDLSGNKVFTSLN